MSKSYRCSEHLSTQYPDIIYYDHNIAGCMPPSGNLKTTIILYYTRTRNSALVPTFINITIFEKNMQSGHCNGILFDAVYHYTMIMYINI